MEGQGASRKGARAPSSPWLKSVHLYDCAPEGIDTIDPLYYTDIYGDGHARS
jgi:hypothetical protein